MKILGARRSRLLLALAGLALCAARAPDTVVYRPGLTAEQLDLDAKLCLAEAKAAEKRRDAPVGYLASRPQGDAEAAAAVAAAGVMKGMNDMQRFFHAHDACLTRLGYSQIPLPEDQKAAFAKLRDQHARSVFIVQVGQAWEAGRGGR
ncbi:hypothetical protein [Caulobacter soli]|uniref:hypothetical protein n=1 Tax=Caulobacter soli TaxID=2708539 RepID=UPI0013EDE5F4|nr:hypothetical protein [Caulobacter soli]